MLLISAYSSGTFPSTANHPSRKVLDDARAAGVPVVVISDDGLLPSSVRLPRRRWRPGTNSAVATLWRGEGNGRAARPPDSRRRHPGKSTRHGTGATASAARTKLFEHALRDYLANNESVANLLLGLVDRPKALE